MCEYWMFSKGAEVQNPSNPSLYVLWKTVEGAENAGDESCRYAKCAMFMRVWKNTATYRHSTKTSTIFCVFLLTSFGAGSDTGPENKAGPERLLPANQVRGRKRGEAD
jgi:hypothetical protein